MARAALAGTVATAAGTAVGPLAAGVLGQYLPAPLRTPYVVELVLLVGVLAALLVFLPPGAMPRGGFRISRPSVPQPVRPVLRRSGSSAVLAWVVTALFLALVPSYLRQSVGTTNMAVFGGVVALLLGSSVVAQISTRRHRPFVLQMTGLTMLVVGLVALVGAAAVESLLLCLFAATVAGAGQGLAFSGSARDVGAAAPAEQRGNVMSFFYLAIYGGVSVCVVAVGLLSTRLQLQTVVALFTVAVSTGCVLCMAGLYRESMRRRVPHGS